MEWIRPGIRLFHATEYLLSLLYITYVQTFSYFLTREAAAWPGTIEMTHHERAQMKISRHLQLEKNRQP
jgi:hypothetical protein